MYRIPKYRIELIRDGSQKTEVKKVSSPSDAVPIIQAYLERVDREHFIILLLDIKNKLIGINTVSIGSLNASVVHPREVFKAAILANAAAIIMAHNHPSGDVEPSKDDIESTIRIKNAGEILGITLLDSIIIGNNYYCSLKERGLV
jgi:DNA repair protein RadC